VSDFTEEIESCIRKRQLFRRGQRILVAVSGGLDSMVLLHVLHHLSLRSRWRLTVAHFNHGLRGRSSEADERLVRRTARLLKLPIIAQTANVRALAQTENLSLEMAARNLRHGFLARAALQSGTATIALAHHADDQVELFFLRLLRGSGSDGLSGMKWRSHSPANPKIELVRPFLEQPKARLRQYAITHRVPWREDASNASLDIQRNRIRHELLPLLRRKYQPTLEKIIARVIDITSAEAQFAAESAAGWLSEVQTSRLTSQIDAKGIVPFDKLPIALQRRCLQSQLLSLGITPEFDLIEQLRLRPASPSSVGASNLTARAQKKDRRAVLRRDPAGIVHLQDSENPSFCSASLELDLNGRAGEARFNGVHLRWKINREQTGRLPRPHSASEVFDADKVGSPILLRHWQPGDRFQPIGMSDSVKLQDFLTNQKIPRQRRHELILAVNACGHVFWVEGLRISERFKLTPTTNRRLHWAWQRL